MRDDRDRVARLLERTKPAHPARLEDIRAREATAPRTVKPRAAELAALSLVGFAAVLALLAQSAGLQDRTTSGAPPQPTRMQENGVPVPEWGGPSVLQLGRGGAIKKRFELKLYGDVPDDAFFKLELDDDVSGPGGSAAVYFCGGDYDRAFAEYFTVHTEVVVVSKEPCKGGTGTTYTYTAAFERGQRVTYSVDRMNLSDGWDWESIRSTYDLYPPPWGIIRPEDVEIQEADTTTTAVYRYDR